jgi:hypothetical protein
MPKSPVGDQMYVYLSVIASAPVAGPGMLLSRMSHASVSITPEPSTLLLMGAVGLIVTRRRTR